MDIGRGSEMCCLSGARPKQSAPQPTPPAPPAKALRCTADTRLHSTSHDTIMVSEARECDKNNI